MYGLIKAKDARDIAADSLGELAAIAERIFEASAKGQHYILCGEGIWNPKSKHPEKTRVITNILKDHGYAVGRHGAYHQVTKISW